MPIFYLIVSSIVLCLQSVQNTTLVANENLARNEKPIVLTKYGQIEGTHDGVSRDGRRFYQFRGIQYAEVKERFKPSVEVKPWNGTKSAKEFGPVCYDVNENCLMLNVFTPKLGSPNATLLPVAFYVHGGAFQVNSGKNYGPNYLIDEDIILITINYRLGILGFLSTGDEASPGNYGLKDQVMALRWVQENIHAFGGDKNKVTLFGQSAGSASVTYHLVSPMSKGLFRHAIAQSGTFLDPWSFTRKPARYAKQLAEHFKCKDATNTTAIVACLKQIPAKALQEVGSPVTRKFFEDPIAAFGPVMEPVVGDGFTAFLSVSPYTLLASGNVTKVPLLSGIAKEEGIDVSAALLLFSKEKLAVESRQALQNNFSLAAPLAFYFDEKAPVDRHSEIAKKVQDFYFGHEGFIVSKTSTFYQLSHLYSDRLFVASAVRFLNLYSKLAPTYPYLYTFNKTVGIEFGRLWKEINRNISMDATHGAELDMILSPLFGQVLDPKYNQVSKSITKLWASFIKTGVPSATYGSERNLSPINPKTGVKSWYQLDMDTKLSNNIFSERIKFWESLGLSDNDFDNCYC